MTTNYYARQASMIHELNTMAMLVGAHKGEASDQDRESLAHLLHRAALVIRDAPPSATEVGQAFVEAAMRTGLDPAEAPDLNAMEVAVQHVQKDGSVYQTRHPAHTAVDGDTLAEEVRLALQYSRNYAEAAPYLTPTAKEHLRGLCSLVEKLHANSAEGKVVPDGWLVRLDKAKGHYVVNGPGRKEIWVESGTLFHTFLTAMLNATGSTSRGG